MNDNVIRLANFLKDIHENNIIPQNSGLIILDDRIRVNNWDINFETDQVTFTTEYNINDGDSGHCNWDVLLTIIVKNNTVEATEERTGYNDQDSDYTGSNTTEVCDISGSIDYRLHDLIELMENYRPIAYQNVNQFFNTVTTKTDTGVYTSVDSNVESIIKAFMG